MDERLKLPFYNPFRLGDWVTDILGHNMQIRSLQGPLASGWYIDEEGTLHEAQGHVDRGIGCIELDEEVLGRMGFRSTQYGDWFLVLYQDGSLSEEAVQKILSSDIPHIGYNPTKHALRIRKPPAKHDEDVTDIFVPCHFVHELQHYLDDAGFEEISFDLS